MVKFTVWNGILFEFLLAWIRLLYAAIGNRKQQPNKRNLIPNIPPLRGAVQLLYYKNAQMVYFNFINFE